LQKHSRVRKVDKRDTDTAACNRLSTCSPAHLQRVCWKYYLGGGDGDLDLTAVGGHQGTVRVDDLDGIVETTVLSQGIEEVLGQVVVLAGGKQLLDTLLLLDTVDGGVLEVLAELGILLDNALDGLQVSIDNIQSLLLVSGSEQGGGVTALNSVNDSGDLDQTKTKSV